MMVDALTRAYVEGNQIRNCIVGIVLELILHALVYGFRLEQKLVYSHAILLRGSAGRFGTARPIHRHAVPQLGPFLLIVRSIPLRRLHVRFCGNLSKALQDHLPPYSARSSRFNHSPSSMCGSEVITRAACFFRRLAVPNL
uniref:Uncharacterized protein n=1 Tax=Anopheles coluzzii TaxID=1518534 RepID=A0A8W7PJF7_ANOCL